MVNELHHLWGERGFALALVKDLRRCAHRNIIDSVY